MEVYTAPAWIDKAIANGDAPMSKPKKSQAATRSLMTGEVTARPGLGPAPEPLSFPAYNINCQIIEDTAENEAQHARIARIGYLGQEHRSEALSLRSLETPDQLVNFKELDEKNDQGTTQFRVTVASTRFYIVDGHIRCIADGQQYILTPFEDTTIETDGTILRDFDSMVRAIEARNKYYDWETPKELLIAVPPNLTTRAKRLPAVLPQVLRFTGDNIHHATITAFARAAEWPQGENYFRGLKSQYKNLDITVYLPDGEQAASLWEFLKKGGAGMVKAHYALWARYYEQVPDGLSWEYVTININEFCRDLGYTPHHKGGFKPEAKRQARNLLTALTSTQMAATFTTPGNKKGHTKTRRLKGPIWSRGLEAEERDTYDDLFGQARQGDPGQWIPVSFSFAPGPWHADREWRSHNKFVGKIGAGLMQLRADRDEWAILIGGYLGALARIGMYRARRLRIKTILENTGLLKAYTENRKDEILQKFYRALDRLQQEGVISGYQTEGFNDSDVDPDDLAALAEYGQSNPYPPGDWRGWVVQINFDFAADTHRLETRQVKAIEAKKRKSQRQRKPQSEAA